MLSKSPLPLDFEGADIDEELLADALRYVPYNRRTLSTLRCVSKPFRSVVQQRGGAWGGHHDMMLSRFGQCVIFNATEDEEGNSAFSLYSVSPVGRKFRTPSAMVLARHHARVAAGLTSLVLHCADVDGEFFQHLGSLSGLRRLELVHCRGITSVADASLAPSLEELEVGFCPLASGGVTGLALPRLRSLRLRFCQDLSQLDGIAAETAAALEVLCVEGCSVYDDTSSDFFARLSPKLRELTLNSVPLDAALAAVTPAALGAVTYLHAGETKVSNETLAVVAPALAGACEFLSLEGCEMLTDVGPLGQMRCLRFLDVSRLAELDGVAAVGDCARLELFRAQECKALQSLEFLKTCPLLRVLDVPCTDLTNSALHALRGAPALETVLFKGCTYVTDVNVLASCPRLTRLIGSHTNINDAGIAALPQCAALEELDLSETAVCSCNALARCPALRTLVIFGLALPHEQWADFDDRPEVQVIADPFDPADGLADY